MKPHLKNHTVLFRPTLRERVDWMAHWVISRSDMMRRRMTTAWSPWSTTGERSRVHYQLSPDSSSE